MPIYRSGYRIFAAIGVSVLFAAVYVWGKLALPADCPTPFRVTNDDSCQLWPDYSVHCGSTFHIPVNEVATSGCYIADLNLIAILTAPGLVVLILMILRAASNVGNVIAVLLLAILTISDIEMIISKDSRMFLVFKFISDFFFLGFGYTVGLLVEGPLKAAGKWIRGFAP